MKKEELAQAWEQFLDAAKNGTKKGGFRGQKIAFCKVALKLSDKLAEEGYNTGERYKEWAEYMGKIYTFLEGNKEGIERTVREYFLALHQGDFSDFSIEFKDKEDGTSTGTICNVKFSGTSHRFYVKCHQRGQRSSSITIAQRYNSTNAPFIQEIFIYKLLENVQMCGVVHFPVPIYSEVHKALYIATEEMNFTLAKELTLETANRDAILSVAFFQLIFRLEDLGTNGGNYGQSAEGKPVIIDFWVVPRDSYILTDAEVREFVEGRPKCNSHLVSEVLSTLTRDERLSNLRRIITEWKLLEMIDKSKLFVDEMATKYKSKLQLSGDLDHYIRDIKISINKFLALL